MIISASRRTDIPRFYYDWLLSRLREGFVLVRNPMNPQQVSRVALGRGAVDGIVFWTKDPAPMSGRLAELGDYSWYMQYTLNAYGHEIEGALPPLDSRIETFKRLAAETPSPASLVWRYSPVVVSARYPEQFHLEQFERIAERLRGHTLKCNLSFLDFYEKIRPKMKQLGAIEQTQKEMAALARKFEAIAKKNGIALGACGNLDVEQAGIARAKCLDAAWLGRVSEKRYKTKKDTGQRANCFCDMSVDIGSYNSCRNGCVYCYANRADGAVGCRSERFDIASPMLCDALRAGDHVTEREMPLLEQFQTSLF